MQNIDKLLNTPQAENIFRRHNVIKRGMTGVREGYNRKGSLFMMELVKAVSPGSVINGNYGDGDEMGPPTMEQFAEQSTTGKGWAFWEKSLSMIGKTGETWFNFKNNLTKSAETAPDPAAEAAQKKSNTIVYVLAIVILVSVAALIFWKRK